jgi:hypothetical protein
VVWNVNNYEGFDPEYDELPEAVQDEILALLPLLQAYGPALGRPHVDKLNNSKHAT